MKRIIPVAALAVFAAAPALAGDTKPAPADPAVTKPSPWPRGATGQAGLSVLSWAMAMSTPTMVAAPMAMALSAG